MSPYIGVLLTLVSIALYNMFDNLIYLFFRRSEIYSKFFRSPLLGGYVLI
jgi:hypothetical protein